jgi:Arc/MetJ-type ribon-helix-helix transcriptional regulator
MGHNPFSREKGYVPNFPGSPGRVAAAAGPQAATTSRPGLKKKPAWYIKTGMDKEFTTVSIPTSLHKKIEEFIKGTEYGSVSSYAAKVLRESLSKADPATEVFSKDEEEKVKERLKALGYID